MKCMQLIYPDTGHNLNSSFFSGLEDIFVWIRLDAIIYYIIINANNIAGKILSGFGCIQTKILFVFMQALVYFCFSKTDNEKE